MLKTSLQSISKCKTKTKSIDICLGKLLSILQPHLEGDLVELVQAVDLVQAGPRPLVCERRGRMLGVMEDIRLRLYVPVKVLVEGHVGLQS